MLIANLDEKNDILYVKFDSTKNSYGDEIQDGVVYLHDIINDNITGITIFDFLKRYEKGILNNEWLPYDLTFNEDIVPHINKEYSS